MFYASRRIQQIPLVIYLVVYDNTLNSCQKLLQYLGLNNHIRQQAREQAPTYYAIGKILSLRPLKIRADGLDLDRDDLRVPESMYSNFIQEKPVEGRGVRTRLPMKEFVCKCALSIGVATRPEEYVYGATILQVDDEVLLMRSSDGQTYYLLERMVELP